MEMLLKTSQVVDAKVKSPPKWVDGRWAAMTLGVSENVIPGR